MTLPFDAELMPAKNRRFEEAVVFVHHFGGDRRTILRHARFVNELGFDAVRFDLVFNKMSPAEQLPITGDLRFGVRHIWANQVESILNAVQGPKILYGFSMPASAAVEAIARRRASDIKALVCDGGPFLQILRCTWNLYVHQYKVKSRLLRAGFTGVSALLWGLNFREQMRSYLNDIPKGFPVLSIRGWQDPLVPVSAIEELFSLQNHLDLEVVALPDGQHLDGLKNFAPIYTARVGDFLKRIGTPAAASSFADRDR